MINILEVKEKMGNGCTVPYIVWCDDGNTYVAKFPGNIQGKKALANEFIASRLCEYLELPILDYKLINVKINDYKEEMRDDFEFIPGTAFATIFAPNVSIILNAGQIRKTINHYDAIKILIFDLLVGNFDRNRGNLLIDLITKKLIMLDHTHIFEIDTLWDETQLPHLIESNFDVSRLDKFNYSIIQESLKMDKEFYEELNKFVQKVKNIKKEYIQQIMNDIPNDWGITLREKELLIDYIYTKFLKVDEVLEILKLKGGGNSDK